MKLYEIFDSFANAWYAKIGRDDTNGWIASGTISELNCLFYGDNACETVKSIYPLSDGSVAIILYNGDDI